MEAPLRSQVLDTVVDYVQTQVEGLAEATKDIPGFHADILPKFKAYANQLRSTADGLKAEPSPNSINALDDVTSAIEVAFDSLSFDQLFDTPHAANTLQFCDEQVEAKLETFTSRLQEKTQACEDAVSQNARHLTILAHHLILLSLNEQLCSMVDENNPAFQNQDKALRTAQSKLVSEIAAVVKASEADVRAVNLKLNAKQTETALSPPTFNETASPAKPDPPTSPCVPALWPPTEEPPALSVVPHRVTLENKRPAIMINVFEDDDDEGDQAQLPAQPTSMENMLASQLTFRQKVVVPKLVSPRFGKTEQIHKPRKMPSHPVVSVRKTTAKLAPPKRLSLGLKMARRSVSRNAWSDD
eukprot:Gregarina_sp_Pseudo_9__2693@NODE_293_length_3263_cov_143_817308_g274_i0_p2_GENE_NODE_293_length_3263_cov_143_817308_g274_i0NODE_293_length_3263_cov_143_817308_g274_i0_p2_ORF_typecomplete_len357_score61_33CCDC154/PF15450_6/0_0033Apolipoprotein/PF01442_18/0_25Apolipoprotein/PF01442_18/2_9e02Transposase_24/PF03004_14/0_18_NODE_293_length_3263_cov_143_817308_g274_i0721142